MTRRVFRGVSVGGVEGLAELLNEEAPEWKLADIFYRGPSPEDGYDVVLYRREGE